MTRLGDDCHSLTLYVFFDAFLLDALPFAVTRAADTGEITWTFQEHDLEEDAHRAAA
jgi:hypothetical protein